MDIPKHIFKAYDIRGVYPREMNEESAYRIGQAFAWWLQKRESTHTLRIVVGRDMRRSSESLAEEVMRGLCEGGVNVIDTGLSSTPMHYFALNHLQGDAGVMVTASHNPAEYNGLKLSGREARPIGLEQGLAEIRDLASQGEFSRMRGGEITHRNLFDAYGKFITDRITLRPFPIVIDAGNGMAGFELPEICERLKIPYTPLFFELDGTFPNHEANPSQEETLEDLKHAMQRTGVALGVAFDGDADRVGFVTEKGELVRGDFVTALLAMKFLRDYPGEKILYDIRSSRIVREVVKEAGGVPVASRVGHAFMKEEMRQEHCIFGGELSQHYYFKDFFFCDSAAMAFLRVLELLSERGSTLSALIAPLKKYAQSGELNFVVQEEPEAVFRRFREQYKNGIISRVDGLTIEYPDWWFNIRASNTEPLVRLNVEADTSELLAEKLAALTSLMQ